MRHGKDLNQRSRTQRREGQALAEYAMILLFVALVCIAASTLLGTTVQGLYNGFNGSF